MVLDYFYCVEGLGVVYGVAFVDVGGEASPD